MHFINVPGRFSWPWLFCFSPNLRWHFLCASGSVPGRAGVSSILASVNSCWYFLSRSYKSAITRSLLLRYFSVCETISPWYRIHDSYFWVSLIFFVHLGKLSALKGSFLDSYITMWPSTVNRCSRRRERPVLSLVSYLPTMFGIWTYWRAASFALACVIVTVAFSIYGVCVC